MVKIIMVCDACGEEIEGSKTNRLNIKYGYDNKTEHWDFEKQIDLCEKCIRSIWDNNK